MSLSPRGAWSIAVESFGVPFRVTADTPEAIERLRSQLPPDARPCPESLAEESFGVLADKDGSYRFVQGGSDVTTGLDLEFALTLLETQLQIYVALQAPNRLFVHAGVVAHDGRAIVIPGLSLAGKTTLVLALVRAGARYYSDEFAVIDERGLVHPFATPPRPRDSGGREGERDVVRLDESVGAPPLPIGVVVLTTYRPGARWEPARLSPGRGALAMLANTVAALKRSEEALGTITRALDGAVVLEGERGEADEIVPELLEAEFTSSSARSAENQGTGPRRDSA